MSFVQAMCTLFMILHSHPKTIGITKSIFLSYIISNIYFKVAKELETYEHEDVFG